MRARKTRISLHDSQHFAQADQGLREWATFAKAEPAYQMNIEHCIKTDVQADLGLHFSHIVCHSDKIMSHYENMPFQIYRKFHLQKLKIFR